MGSESSLLHKVEVKIIQLGQFRAASVWEWSSQAAEELPGHSG